MVAVTTYRAKIEMIARKVTMDGATALGPPSFLEANTAMCTFACAVNTKTPHKVTPYLSFFQKK
jgi:hypothetical protein